MKYIYAFLILAFLPISPAYAQPQVAARVLITKSDRQLYIFDSAGNVLRSYHVALGSNPAGHKREVGDGRTPEGRYVIEGRNSRSEYFLSLKISYPSKRDREAAKRAGVNPGGDIFIHGQPNTRSWQLWKYGNKRDWTQGCVALTDKDMEEIWTIVPDGTPVVIVP